MRHKNAEKYGYKVTSSVLEHENPYYAVRKYEVKTPAGIIESYWIIEQRPFPIVIPLFEDKTTLLVGQYRVPADYYSWEFPMGAAKSDDVLGTAKSELAEETGYTAGSWKQIGTHFIGPGRMNVQGVAFLAEDLQEGKAQPDPGEFLHVKRLPVAEVGEMIKSGIILCGPTIAAYHFLEKYLEKREVKL